MSLVRLELWLGLSWPASRSTSPDPREDPFLFLIKDFLMVTVTEKGDSTMFQFKFDFLI